MKYPLLCILLYHSSLQAGILIDSFEYALNNNHNIKLSHAKLNYETASNHYENKRSNIKLVADGFARYYTPQKSGLSDANFNLPNTTAHETFTKANFNIALSKDIYNPKTIALKALGKEKVKKASFALKHNKNMLILDIVHDYIDILKQYDQLKLTKARYALSNKELEEAIAKEEVEEMDRVQVALIGSKNREYKVRQALALDRFKNVINNFELLTQNDLDKINLLKQSINHQSKEIPSLSFYQEALVQKHPKLLELQKNIEIAHKHIAVIQAKYNPSLTAQMGYEYTQNYTPVVIGRTYESGAFVGLSTVIPLYTGGRNHAETQKEIMQVQEEEEKKAKETSQLLLSLKKEYRLYNSLILEIEVAKQHLETLALLNEQARVKVEVGTMFPIEKAKINYQYKEAESYLKHLEYNYILADSNVKYLSGTLNRDDLIDFESKLNKNQIFIHELIGR